MMMRVCGLALPRRLITRIEYAAQPKQSAAVKSTGNWADALWPYAEHPERYDKNTVVDFDDRFVVIRDQYPKVRARI
jgi:hypothetical protein